ncbi:MAG: serine/threonine-protein kinase [Deltaproteobacteria bacterium]
MALSDRNDAQGTLLGLQAEPLPLPGLSAPAIKYHTLMELGRGGSAVVSAALARGIGGFSKLVVLKTTKEELCGHPDAVRSSLNEAKLAARMNHPNIVQVYEVYQDQGVPVIVMEYLDGLSLSRVARQGTPMGQTLEVALSVLCKVLEGVRYAHALSDFDGSPLGIVHRDISPQNVMLTYDGQVKLVDFGTAKLMAGGEQTSSGMLRGKLGYMPPEQVCAEGIDARVDVFAVGVMLWEAVAGRRIWGELNHAGIIRRLMDHDIPKLSEAVPELDPELDRICARALAPARDQRYPDADSFLRDLERYLAGRGGSVSAFVLGDMVQRSCADLKRSRDEALRAALARVEDWQLDEDDDAPELTRTQLPLPRPAQSLSPSKRTLRRLNARWAALLLGCLLGGIGLARYSSAGPAPTLAGARPTPAAALEASVALAAPAPAALAANSAAANDEEPIGEALLETRRNIRAPSTRKNRPEKPLAAQRGTHRAAPRPSRKTPVAPLSAPPNPCDPPYSIDDHGIKRFHRECLTGKR